MLVFTLARIPAHVKAADSDFSNGISVDSTADTADSIVGDGNCDDGTVDHNCTLRAAIQEANVHAGADTINFNLSGIANFTNGGQNGYTIALSNSLPQITSPITIDGYSQANAVANSAVAPAPFDGTLLVEIDGSLLDNASPGTSESCVLFGGGADASIIKGLVINKCGGNGIILETANHVTIAGNYIGTDPTGLIDEGNGRDNVTQCVGSGIGGFSSNHITVGGTNPEDRNIVAGNQCDDMFIGNEANNVNPSSNNIIQGNYVGLGSNGLTALPSGWAPGSGNAILMGNSHDDLIGGTTSGAINVVGSSKEFGMSFRYGCSATTIQGNYIGTDYTGNATVTHANGTGNINTGVHIFDISSGGTSPSHDFLVGGSTSAARNVIAGNSNSAGGWVASGVEIKDGSYNNTVSGNYIGVGANGTTALGNQGVGVLIHDNGSDNNLIGGSTPQEANIVAHNGEAGIVVGDYSSAALSNVSLLGNSIFDNGNLGIDLGKDGVSANDSLDSDTGPNNLLNFPMYSNVSESSGNTTVDYWLDAPAGDYRVEFFSNTTADTSGNGEGQTYLGFANITSAGTGSQQYSKILTGITGVTNLALTSTQRNLATASTFGSTSEFGGATPPVTDIALTKTLDNPGDVAQGATLNYTVTLTNNGPGSINLTSYDVSGGSNFLFFDLADPDLTFVSSPTSGVSCFSPGTATDIGINSIF